MKATFILKWHIFPNYYDVEKIHITYIFVIIFCMLMQAEDTIFEGSDAKNINKQVEIDIFETKRQIAAAMVH